MDSSSLYLSSAYKSYTKDTISFALILLLILIAFFLYKISNSTETYVKGNLTSVSPMCESCKVPEINKNIVLLCLYYLKFH